LKGQLELYFSHSFSGTLWNTLVVPEDNVLVLEIRDHQNKQVTFSVLHYVDKTFLWNEVKLDEPWWVGLAAAAKGMILFTLYLETANPDKKGILAYSLADRKLCWWNNDFSLTSVSVHAVAGLSSRYGIKPVALDLKTGVELPTSTQQQTPQSSGVQKPVQYTEGTANFDTVRTFLGQKLNLIPVSALEYLEANGFIFVSYYVSEIDLVNYLLVLSMDGNVVLHEKLDEHLKGIGLDTFFILSGFLIFVKNKRELVSYQML